jgi:GT2 family glycosyltransferase
MRDMGERRPLVTVGIVTWNSEKDLPACLQGVAAQKYPAVEIVVVDNGSSDGSLHLIREALPQSRVIINDGNLGYCVAHNQAIRASRGEYYLALNPDVRLLPGFIERLVESLESRPECGSAVGKFWQVGEQEPRTLDAAGLFMDRRRHQWLRGHGQPDRGQYDQPQEVFGADGAAPLHRRAMLEDVKVSGEYFDEQFFGYMEDVDLAWRARLLGWRCWYEPGALATHVRTFKPGRRRTIPRHIRRMAVKNRYLMMLKNEGREEFRRDWWRILGYDLAIWGYILLLEQSSLRALALLRRQWDSGQAWRQDIWKRVTAKPRDRLRWFE